MTLCLVKLTGSFDGWIRLPVPSWVLVSLAWSGLPWAVGSPKPDLRATYYKYLISLSVQCLTKTADHICTVQVWHLGTVLWQRDDSQVLDTILTVGYTADKETRISQIYKSQVKQLNASISDDSCYPALFEEMSCFNKSKETRPLVQIVHMVNVTNLLTFDDQEILK